jgi:hypothetical protein
MCHSETTLPDVLRRSTFNGAASLETDDAGIAYFVNEYWTSGQLNQLPGMIQTATPI